MYVLMYGSSMSLMLFRIAMCNYILIDDLTDVWNKNVLLSCTAALHVVKSSLVLSGLASSFLQGPSSRNKQLSVNPL